MTLDETVGSLQLVPSPRGDGRTAGNWSVLARAGADDLDTARLAEAHLDAATILDELGGSPPTPGSRWGVWAAEAGNGSGLRAESEPDGRWFLSGRKPWCSGALGPCTHALVTARADDGGRLFAIRVSGERSDGERVSGERSDGERVSGERSDGERVAAPGVHVRTGEWQGVGMRGSAAATVEMAGVEAVAVGGPGDYLERPGFWHGAIAVAAAWSGGAAGVAAPLYQAGRDGRLDDHGLAHLGAVDASLAAVRTLLGRAAAEVDAQPDSRPDEPLADARRRALQVRAVVEDAVEGAIRRTGRALGPAPLAAEADHAQRVADLELYVRQSHAERDLATLGALAAGAP